jgi:hypothetical protein
VVLDWLYTQCTTPEKGLSMMDYEDVLTADTMRKYSLDLLEAMQYFHEAQRHKLLLARRWDEYFASGMANGQFAGKNEATRLGEAINANMDLWMKLQAATEEALKREHRFKEVMVIDKWVGRTIRMMEVGLGRPIIISQPDSGIAHEPMSDEEYRAFVEKMSRGLVRPD